MIKNKTNKKNKNPNYQGSSDDYVALASLL